MVNSVLCVSWALLLGLRPAAQLLVQYYHIGVCMSVILCIALLGSHCGSMLQLCASRWVPVCGGCASACMSMQLKGRWCRSSVRWEAPASVSSALAMLAALKQGSQGALSPARVPGFCLRPFGVGVVLGLAAKARVRAERLCMGVVYHPTCVGSVHFPCRFCSHGVNSETRGVGVCGL